MSNAFVEWQSTALEREPNNRVPNHYLKTTGWLSDSLIVGSLLISWAAHCLATQSVISRLSAWSVNETGRSAVLSTALLVARSFFWPISRLTVWSVGNLAFKKLSGRVYITWLPTWSVGGSAAWLTDTMTACLLLVEWDWHRPRKNNNNVHLSCAHQFPERSHDTY